MKLLSAIVNSMRTYSHSSRPSLVPRRVDMNDDCQDISGG
jgi:hypothetical protein